jgi:hypothetical protein
MNTQPQELLLGARISGEFVMLDPEERRRHLSIVGQTGTGKSTLLLNLIAQDLAAGAGIALLDPHGATVLMLPRLLIDEPFWVRLIEWHVRDPMVRSFWLNEYAGYRDHFRAEAISPIQNERPARRRRRPSLGCAPDDRHRAGRAVARRRTARQSPRLPPIRRRVSIVRRRELRPQRGLGCASEIGDGENQVASGSPLGRHWPPV